jgi:hypothetical protein
MLRVIYLLLIHGYVCLVQQKGPIAMHWLSGDGHILWCNERELEILQYTAEG